MIKTHIFLNELGSPRAFVVSLRPLYALAAAALTKGAHEKKKEKKKKQKKK